MIKKIIAMVMFLLAINIVFADDLSTGLLLKYKFNATAPLNDSYGNYEPLINLSMPALGNGVIAQSAYFDNTLTTGTHKAYYNNSNLKIDTFSVNAWLYPYAFADLSHIIFSDGYIDSGKYYGWVFTARGNGSLQAWIFTGDALTNYCLAMGGTGVNINKWSMVTMVFDDTNNWLAFYINGTIGYNMSCAYSPNYTIDFGFSMGAPFNTGIANALNGLIDEIAVWNRTLTSSEITSIFDTEKTGIGFESNFSGGGGGNESLSNTISIQTPTNLSYSFQTANVSITTTLNSTCKYSTSTFDYNTQGTLFSTTGLTTHYFILNVTDATYSYYYACNSTAGITNSSQHLFYGKSKNWVNEYLFTGDSVTGATPYVGATQRFSYLIPQYLTNNGFYGITEENTAVDGTCCTNVGACNTKNPLQNRLSTSILSHNSRFIYIEPCVNDQVWNVSTADWGTAWDSMYNTVRATDTNSTLILSSSTLVYWNIGNQLSNAKQADYDTKIREYAILNNIPYAEVHYALNNNASYLVDEAHLSVAGHKKVNETLSAITQSLWTMNTSNYNIYHDCNNTITVLNTTLSMPSANCADQTGLADWLIMKNISASSILIERADKPFYLNLSGKTPSTYYNVTINNGSLYSTLYLSNSTGGINNIAMPTGTNYNILLGESTPSINIVSPANNTRSNQPLDVAFNISNYGSNLSCSLYIDNSLNMTNATVLPDTETHFVVDIATEGIYNWYVNCSYITGDVLSNVYNYPFDNSQPFMHWFSPSYLNTTIVDNNISVHIDVTDDYLYRVNATIYAPNASILYNNYSGDLVATTNYSIQQYIDTSILPQGIYTIVMEGADSHTGQTFERIDAIQEMPEESKYIIQLAKDAPEFVVSDGLAMDFVQQDDRISFVMTADKAERKSFTFKTDEKLVEIKGSQYPCHYVFGDYWFDCEGLENPTATLQNDYELLVEFDVPAEPQSEIPQGDLIEKAVIGEGKIEAGGEEIAVGMKSLGGLNENREVATFEVDHCDSDWTCSAYGSCGLNDTANCTSVTDVALCGFNYTGDYSEFAPQSCNYCTPNLTIQFITDCDAHNRTKNVMYNYTNYGACCFATGLETDCNLSQIAEYSFGDSAYYYFDIPCNLWTYGTEDMPFALIDGTAKLIIEISVFAILICLVIVWIWVAKRLNWKKWW